MKGRGRGRGRGRDGLFKDEIEREREIREMVEGRREKGRKCKNELTCSWLKQKSLFPVQEYVYVAESRDAGRGDMGAKEVVLHDITEPVEQKTPQTEDKKPQPVSK